MTKQHAAIDPEFIHAPHAWVVTDAAARLALTVDEADERKYCLQQDDGDGSITEWMLVQAAPTVWLQRAAKGGDGEDGDDGHVATITVGSVTTGAPGSSASVTNSGTENAAILDFVIPRGDTGSGGDGGGPIQSGDIEDATDVGKAVLTAPDEAAARLALGASSFSGNYDDLTDKPTLFGGAYADLSGKPTLFTGAYADLTGKPSLGTAAALNVPASGNAASGEVVKGSDGRLSDARDTSSARISDATAVGKALVVATDAAAARTAIGAGTSTFSGSYTDLTSKPTLGTAAALNVPASGNAASGEVVKGNDGRLTDARDTTTSRITDATAAGRALLTAANAAAQRTALALGTSATLAVDTDTTLAADSDTRVPSQHAVKAFVGNAVTGLLKNQGDLDASANPNYPAAVKGDTYVVSVAGKVGGASGASVEIGDMVSARANNAGGTQAAVGASWFVLEHNLIGALMASNNLSDLSNAATARTNLGVPAGSGTSTGTNTGDQTTITGNAGSATVLQTARNINGVSFNGSANITIGVAASDVTGTVAGANGGTGVANTGKTITLGGSLTTSGAFTTALTATANTSVTLPTTGTLATLAGTETLTNKRVTARVGSATSSATPAINTDSCDIYKLTAQTVDITSMTSGLTGTPVDGDVLVIQITGTSARAIVWGTAYEASTVALPTTTVTTAMLTVGFIFNGASAKWRCVAAV